jgi:hypothetical protein
VDLCNLGSQFLISVATESAGPPIIPLQKDLKAIPQMRWNSLTAFLVEVSGHTHESFKTRVFFWFSTIILLFYKILFMNIFEFSQIFLY